MDIRNISISVRFLDGRTGEVAIRIKFHLFMNIALQNFRIYREKSIRNPVSIDRVICWEANIEHEVEATRCCNNADISNTNTSTTVLNWQGSAWGRKPNR